MMSLKRLALAAVASALLTSVAWSESSRAPRKFSVGVGMAVSSGGRVVRGATAPGGSLTVTRSVIMINADGSQQVTVIYTNGNGSNVHQRTLFIDGACTRVVDSFGNTVSATGPAAECSAAATFTTQLDTTIGNAATGGKLNL